MSVIDAVFPFLLAFMSLMCTGAWWWKRALFIADAISWSIMVGSGTLLSPLSMRLHSAMLNLAVGAGAGLASIFSFCGGTVSLHLVSCGVGTDEIVPPSDYVALGTGVGVGVGIGLGACARLALGFRFGFGFGFGFGH